MLQGIVKLKYHLEFIKVYEKDCFHDQNPVQMEKGVTG